MFFPNTLLWRWWWCWAAGNLPVEVAVIGSFAPGEGERFYHRSVALQAQHLTFVDEYNEVHYPLPTHRLLWLNCPPPRYLN